MKKGRSATHTTRHAQARMDGWTDRQIACMHACLQQLDDVRGREGPRVVVVVVLVVSTDDDDDMSDERASEQGRQCSAVQCNAMATQRQKGIQLVSQAGNQRETSTYTIGTAA